MSGQPYRIAKCPPCGTTVSWDEATARGWWMLSRGQTAEYWFPCSIICLLTTVGMIVSGKLGKAS